MEVMEKVSDFTNKVACFLKREKDEFKKMSKAEKRVAVAEDVIAQIKAEVYTPESGTYVRFEHTSKAVEKGYYSLGDLYAKPADLMMDEGMLNCNVCAKGAMFLSHIRKDSDECTVSQAADGGDEQIIENRLTDLFSEEQLDLIEAAFETEAHHYTDDHGTDDDFNEDGDPKRGTIGAKAERFGDKYSTDQRRLMAIMRNIIRNKGTFKL